MFQRPGRLSRRTQERLIEHFVAGTTARAAAQLVGVHRAADAYRLVNSHCSNKGMARVICAGDGCA